MIEEESVREVLETARAEEVVGDFVQLRRRGQNYIGLCPFHSEKTPSFNVNPQRNIYKCFGCGEGGDPAKFLMEYEQLSFPDAIRWLARKYNIKLKEKEVSQEFVEEEQAKESLFLINAYALQYYQDQLLNTERGRSVGLSYFKNRGYTEEIIKEFGLGYAPPEGTAFTKTALQVGYQPEQLDQLGLSRNGRDFFRDRVIFAIHNASGKVAAFAGRILKKNVKAPKYINSPETEVYHKSDVLYGMYQARRAVRKEDNCYLVEGYTDVISLHQAGIRNVVASSGTSLTPGQIKLVKRYTQNVTLLYDGDNAGMKAALRGADLLLEADMNIRIVFLPDGEDPDSFVQAEGAAGFQAFVDANRQDFLIKVAEVLLKGTENDPIERSKAIEQILSTLAKIMDPSKRSLYIRRLSELANMDERSLLERANYLLRIRLKKQRQETERQERRDQAPLPGQEPPMPGEEAGPPPPEAMPPEGKFARGHEYQERDLARLLMIAGSEVYDSDESISVAQHLIDNIEDVIEDFDHPLYQKIVELTRDELERNGRAPAPEFYIRHTDPEISKLALHFSVRPDVLSENWQKRWNIILNQKMPDENFRIDSDQALHRFRLMKLVRMCRTYSDKIKSFAEAGDEEQLLVHLKVLQRLQGIRDELAKELRTVLLP